MRLDALDARLLLLLTDAPVWAFWSAPVDSGWPAAPCRHGSTGSPPPGC